MTATTILDLYRGRINVWVEDDLTLEVLTGMWHDPMLHVIAAGGSEAVRSMVRAAANNRKLRDLVVGVIDRDFEADAPDWTAPDTRVFVLPAHEIENLLLDFEVLGAMTDKPADELRLLAHTYAQTQRWWAVGKLVLRALRKATSRGFPADPPEGLRDAEAVAAWLDRQRYWQTHAEELAPWRDLDHRRRAIAEFGDMMSQDLETEAWTFTFPGKEVLRHLRTHVPGLDRTPQRTQPSPTTRDLDLAKRITRHMVEVERVPGPLVDLRAQLRRRASPS